MAATLYFGPSSSSSSSTQLVEAESAPTSGLVRSKSVSNLLEAATGTAALSMDSRTVAQLDDRQSRRCLKEFVSSITSELKGRVTASQYEALESIEASLASRPTDLHGVKEYAQSIKNQLIDILRGIDEKTISSLKATIPLPRFCENLWDILKAYRKNTLVQSRLTKVILDVCYPLVTESGEIERARDIAVDFIEKKEALDVVASHLRDRQSARMPSATKWSVEEFLLHMCLELVRANDVQGAERVAREIAPSAARDRSFTEVCSAYLEMGDIEKAIAIVHEMPRSDEHDRALENVCRHLIEAGDAPRAVEEASRFSQEDIALRAVGSLLHNNEPECALSLIRKMSCIPLKQKGFAHVVELYLERGEVDKAHLIVKEITGISRKVRLLESICSFHIRSGNLENAAKIVQEVSCRYSRASMHEQLFRAHLDRGEYSMAIEYAKKQIWIRDQATQLHEVCIRFLSENNYEGALDVARDIPSPSHRREAFIAINVWNERRKK